MFGFIKKAAKSVGGAVKSVAKTAGAITKVVKPVAAGVAIVYPPAAPIAAGVFVADKALNAVNVKPGTPKFKRAVRIVAAKHGLPPRAAAAKLTLRYQAGQRTLANTFKLAAAGHTDAARAATLITKRAAARREAHRWKVRANGRIVRAA